MSSTALVGVLRGGELTLACAGDSRAYLVTQTGAEQLTVDGDVRCTQLAEGAPPEEVGALGVDALALYTCLGVGEVDARGAFRCSVERSTPQVSRWRLLPGDVVVLCTDGLVEEGVFLSPADLAGLVAEGRGLPAQALAERLVAAADVRQREPSPQEPDGLGDNITCVVLVVAGEEAEES
jgi:serine/threonine protein phosphatase PrpC